MLIYALLLILLLRPGWGLLAFFTLIAGALWVISGLGAGQMAQPVVMLVALAINIAIFYAVGALIVFLRLRFRKGRSRQDKEVDAELARIRAEAVERDRQPPTT